MTDATAPLTERLFCRLTEAEYTEIRAAAERAGATVSAYARLRLIGYPVSSATDAGTRAELARIGALIKRFSVDVADREKCNDALAELVAAVRRLAPK